MIAGMALLATARKPAAVIAVAPVGEAPAAEVAALVPVLSESFGCEIVIAPADTHLLRTAIMVLNSS